MAVISGSNISNPLLLPEIVGLVIDNVSMVQDLLNCACVNSTWNRPSLKKLYKGSLSDMQFRTPDIASLNCLFVASRNRFSQNMRFVKHLLLAPETPTHDEVAEPDSRFACLEKIRALGHRESRNALFHSQGKGLTSLIIPFEILDQKWSLKSDFLLPSSIRFLAIDGSYINRTWATPDNTSVAFADSISKLRALTIYKSESNLDIPAISELLSKCDLHLFHIEETHEEDGFTQFDIVEFLPCLNQHQDLEALALVFPNDPYSRPELLTSAGDELALNWPKLKALYLDTPCRRWFTDLSNFQELQILNIRKLGPEKNRIDFALCANIAKCQNLRSLDIRFVGFDNVEALLDIARGCQKLQKLSVWGLIFREESGLVEDFFFDLICALPQVEVLALGLKFRIDSGLLGNMAYYCPQLTILELPQCRLYLSLPSLKDASYSFQNLKSMHCRRVLFEPPRTLIRQGKILEISKEWRRIFPKLEQIPCPADIYSQHMGDDNTSDESSEDGATNYVDERILWDNPELDYDDYMTCWFILRVKLWRALGYGTDPSTRGMGNVWQSDLEIQITGWPVIPLKAFSNTEDYSLSNSTVCVGTTS